MPSNFTSDDNTRISTIENKVSNLQQAFATIDSGEQSELQSFLNETSQKFVYSGFVIQKISGTMRLGVAKGSDSDSIAYVNGNRVRSDDKTTANNFAVQIPSTDSSGYQRHLIVLNTAGLIVALSSAVNADYDYATAEADGMLVLAELHVPASTVLNLDSVSVTLTDKRRFYAMAERLPSYYVPGRLFMLTAAHGTYSAGLYAYNGSTWNYVAPPTGGVIPVSQGGTGVSSFASGNVLIGNGTSPIVSSNLRVVGQVLSHTDGTSFIMSGTATDYTFYTPNVTNMRFQVGAYPQVTITNDGKLGVGANLIPSYPLHVRLENNLLMGFTGSGGIAYMRASNSAGTGLAPLYIVGQSIGMAANSTYGIALMSNGDIKLGSNDSLFINYANNRAGMGTQNPLGKFDSRATFGPQLVASYNDSVYTGITTDSFGKCTISPTGNAVFAAFFVSEAGVFYINNQASNNQGVATVYRTLSVNRGLVGATHHGSGSDGIFSGEAADFLGIRGESGIQFGVSSYKLLHLSRSGAIPRFGINNFNPQHYLDIAAIQNGSGYAINIDSTTRTSSDVVFNITGTSGTSIFNVQAGGTTSASSLSLTSNLSVAGNLTVDTNTLFVDAANNKVGIGTASPQTPLHVKGYEEIVWIETTNPIGLNFIRFRNPSGNMGYIGYGSSGNNNFIISNELNGDMSFLIDSSVKMTLKVDGKLGLGTAAPEAPLHVTGTIRTVANDTSTIFVSNNTSAGGSDQFRIKNNFGAVDIENLRGSLDLYPNGSGVARFTNTGLAIGGLFNPSCALDIRSATPSIKLRNTSAAGSAVYAVLEFQDNTGSILGYVGYGSASTPHLYISNQLAGDIRFAANTKSMVFDSSGNFIVNTNTLFVDAVNNRVGIGTASPATILDMRSSGNVIANVVSNDGNSARLQLVSSGVYGWSLDGGAVLNYFRDATKYMSVDGSLNIAIGGHSTALGKLDSRSTSGAQLVASYSESVKTSLHTTPTGEFQISPTGSAIHNSFNVSGLGRNYVNNQAANNQGVATVYRTLSIDRGQIGATHTGSGSYSFFSGEAANALGIRAQIAIQLGIGTTGVMQMTSGGLYVGGLSNPSAKLHAVSTTEQLRLGYDGSNYASHTVNASGNYTIALTGGLFTVTLGMRSLGFSSPTTASFLLNSGSASSMTGTNNTAMGYGVLNSNTTGYYNTAVGSTVLNSNTTGYYNTAVGSAALTANTAGFRNTAIGVSTLVNNTTGNNNTAIGYSSLFNNTTGTENTAVGRSTLTANTTGSNNTAIGYNAESTTATASNEVTLGNSSVTALRCNVTTISSLSDRRDKSKIKEIQNALDFINDLIPVYFEWERRDGSMKGVKDSGFIAQDLDEAQKKHNIDYLLNLVYKSNPEKLEASYGKLLPMIVKAVQELSAKVDALAAQ